MNTQTTNDVVIVGGGIYGTNLAYELSKAGKNVTLLEADTLACGASGGPGERGVRANGRDVRELPIAALALERWRQYQQTIEGGVGYRRIGGICAVTKDFGAREDELVGVIQARALVQNAMGCPTQFLSRDETLALEPELSPGIFGAIYSPEDGVGDHTFATRQFGKEAEKLGATVRTDAKVVEVLTRQGNATGVKLQDGEVIPVQGQLALLANAGMLPILQPLLGAAEILPVHHLMPQMLYVTNPDGRTIHHLLAHMQRPLAIKQLPDGTLMLSGGLSVSRDTDGAISGTLSSMALNLKDAIQTVPFLERSAFITADATRTETVAVDGIPIIGQPEALHNTIYGFAWSGHGYAISLGFTKYLTDWLLTGNKPQELEPFSPRRFIDPAHQAMTAVKAQQAAFGR